jgi:hypothetical protein
MFQHCARVGGDEEFAVPETEQHRRAAPRNHDLPGIGLRDDPDPVGLLQMSQRRNDALLQRRAGRLFDQVN